MNNRRMGTYSKGKAKDFKGTIRKLGSYLYRFRHLLILALLLTIASSALALLNPYLTGKILGEIQKGADIDFSIIYHYAILMFIFYFSSAILSLLINILMIRISKKIVYSMRKDAFNKLIKLKISYFDNNLTGDVISRLTYDIDTVNTSLSTDVIQIITSIITVIGSLIMMIIISPILVSVFAITIPLSILFVQIMVKKTSKFFKKRSEELGKMNGFTEEMITGEHTIMAYAKADNIINDFDEYNKNASDACYKAEYYSSFTGPGVTFVNNLSLALICLFGAILSKRSIIGIEEIGSFILYSRRFSGPINEIANIVTDLQSSVAAAERVFNLIDSEEETADIDTAKQITVGDVSFNHVYFGYNKDKLILEDISFTALKGKRIAIVGPTGSGKTTIVNLLMRFYDINNGSILINNIPHDNLKKDSLRKNFAMVLQDTWLFTGSIYDNLVYGNNNVSKEKVVETCKLCHIDTFINNLPNGYDTIITESGINMSKGERQLLTIARAMLLENDMLILDEATSNVDTRTEMLVQDFLNLLMNNKTCFIIAHRLSTIKNCDLILVIKDGKLIEQGSHEELMAQGGFYYELQSSKNVNI